jgi:uncharacterized protein
MLEFKVTGIGIDTRTDNPLVILHSKDTESDLILPIWIGRMEAQSIAIALQGEVLERPLTHDLMANIIESLNYSVVRVTINSVSNGTFFAQIILQHNVTEEEVVLDARPSDSIAIALRVDCQIFVSEAVKETSCIPALIENYQGDEQEDLASDPQDTEDFLKFLDNVKASDFKLPPEDLNNLNG